VFNPATGEMEKPVEAQPAEDVPVEVPPAAQEAEPVESPPAVQEEGLAGEEEGSVFDLPKEPATRFHRPPPLCPFFSI